MLRNLQRFCSQRTRLQTSAFPRSFHFSPLRGLPRVPHNVPINPIPKAPSFREEVARSSTLKSFSEQVRYPGIRNQIVFFAFGSFVAFSLAANFTNYDTAYWAHKLSEGSGFWTVTPPSSDQMKKARYFEHAKSMQKGLDDLRGSVEAFPLAIKSFVTWAYVYAAQPLVDAKESRRICWTIALLNTGVWIAWQIPRIRPFMMASFTHNPLSGKSYTLLTSVFSHKSFFHLLFNSMALTSFGSAACEYLTREQFQSRTGFQESTVQYHLIAFLISAGLFSGLVSHVISARIRFPQLVAQFKKSASQSAATGAAVSSAKNTILPSLGASGAIYSAVVVTALAYPESEVALIFPPTPQFPIQWGVGALITLDIVGVLRGWRLFDHFAHLGGAAFGAFYYAYGPQIWDFFRIVNPVTYRPPVQPQNPM